MQRQTANMQTVLCVSINCFKQHNTNKRRTELRPKKQISVDLFSVRLTVILHFVQTQKTRAGITCVLLSLLFLSCSGPSNKLSVSQGPICLHNFTCCHTETDIANPASLSHPVTAYWHPICHYQHWPFDTACQVPLEIQLFKDTGVIWPD